MVNTLSKIRMDYRVLGDVGTNCYLVINDDTKEAVLIDPADCADKIEQMISENGVTLKAILLTHGHYDHITAADDIRKMYDVKIYASCDEAELLLDTHKNLSAHSRKVVTLKADVLHKDGDILELAGINIEVKHTPGHTIGGSCYYIKEAGMLFSGDTLFAESVGRTDFPTGSMSQIVHSIKDKLMNLPEDTKVFPGHGESTSIGYEKK